MTKIAGTRVIDIANAAGVSIATVDRVLNKRKGVRSMTAERVWEAVNRLATEQPPPTAQARAGTNQAFDFILPSGAGPNIDNLRRALETAGEAQGSTVRCHIVERLNPAALAEKIRSLAASGSDGLGFLPLEHPRVRDAVDRLHAAGIPAVTIMSDLSNANRVAYIGIDNRAAGRTAGYLMGRFVRETAGKVAILGHALYRNHEEREMGFRSLLREQFSHLETLDLVVGQDSPDANYDQIRALLAAHPDLVGIYSIGSGNRGVVQALADAGRTDDITLIAHNLTETTRAFLLDGAMDAVIHQDVEREAELALMILARWSTRGDTNVKALPVQIYVRENIGT